MEISTQSLGHALGERYRVEGPLGAGGMAEVFLATDLRHGRQVAVKVLRPEVAEGPGPDRFAREIGIVARLAHPNIVPLHDSGTSQGLAWFVMPFVEGQSLYTRLKEGGALAVHEAVRITLEVADALGYAHRLGVVHRDIKPQNLLLEAGHAVVADFGVARAIAQASGRTQPSTFAGIGTPAYMSPEQSTGHDEVDGRSDLYSLALVLHEMLSGQLPPRAVTPAGTGFRFRLRGRVRRGVPRAFHGFFATALSAAPEDRFQSAEAFAAALRAAAERHGATRWRSTLVGASAGALVLVAGLLFLRPAEAEPRALSPRRIVITPLANRTGDPALSSIGEIASDWIAGGLQRTGIVEIVPSETAIEAHRRWRADSGGATADPIRAIAQETGAGLVVSGAYYQREDELLLRLQVADANTGTLLESSEDVLAPMANPLAGVIALRSRLMGWLALHYDERLRGQDGQNERPPEFAAYQIFAQGMDEYVANRNAPAAESFLRAAALDSTFTLARLYASIALTNVGDYGRADSVLRRAFRERSALSEYHRAWLDSRLAFVAGDNIATLRAIRRAATLAPGSKAEYNLAVAAFQAGAGEEALSTLQRLGSDQGAMRGFAPYWDLLGAVHHDRGDLRAERRVAEEARARHPDRLAALLPEVRALAARGSTRSLWRLLDDASLLPADPIGWTMGDLLREGAAEELRAHGHDEPAALAYERAATWYRARGESDPRVRWELTRIAYARGDWAESSRLLALADSSAPLVERLGLEGLVAAHLGDRSRAQSLSDSLERSRTAYGFGSVPLFRARIAAVLGDRATGVAFLDQAFAEGKEFDLWLHRDRDLARLRGFAPFEALIKARRSAAAAQ